MEVHPAEGAHQEAEIRQVEEAVAAEYLGLVDRIYMGSSYIQDNIHGHSFGSPKKYYWKLSGKK